MIQFSPELPKAPSEVLPLSMDFARWLASGETISTCSWASSVYTGTDPNPSAMIQGAATITGTEVSQTVGGGLDGVVYLFSATITTSLGNTYVGRSILRVSAAA
jgi:hypothetical protein